MTLNTAGSHPDLSEIGTLIVGGGVTGLSLALFLACEGHDVAIVDAGFLGGSTTNAGSLHVQMQGRFLRRNPEQAPALESTLHLYPKAVRFWQELERELDADFDLRLTGGLMVAETQAQLDFLVRKARRERQLGLDVEILDRAELRRIAPYLGPHLIGGQFCSLEGKVNPLLANAVLRKRATALGVRILYEPVLGLQTVRPGFQVSTLHGNIRAGQVVLAAGAGSRALAAGLGLHIPAQARALHMNITDPMPPVVDHLIQHSELPMTLKQLNTGQIVIGGGWQARMSGRGEFASVQLSSIIGSATLAYHLVPAIGPARIVRTWAGITTTVDGRSVLGPASAVPNLFLAIPGFGGYTLGPLIARLVADVVMGRKPCEDLAPYSVDRFGPQLSDGRSLA